MTDQLSTRAARGAALTVGVQAGKFAVQFGGVIVLSRLLPPADFGTVAMVTAIIGIADVLRDFGLSAAAVQMKKLSDAQAANLFWINTVLGVLLAVLCALSGPILVGIYHDPRLFWITLALSLSFAINGAQTQFQAHLTRGMRYRELSLTDISAQAAALAVAIVAAVLGMHYWALVLQVIAQAVFLLIARVSVARWTPGLPNRSGDVRQALRYGRNLAGTQVIVYASTNVDSVLVGARFGAEQLGIYNRAYQLLVLPMSQVLSPLTNVALPVLSRLQDDRERFLSYLTRAQTLVVYVSVALFAVAVSCAPYAIRLVLGSAWDGVAPIFQILAIGGAFQAVNYVTYWAYISLGLTAQNFWYSVTSRIFLIAFMIVGSLFSPLGVAVGFSIGMVLAWPVSLLWLRRAARLPVGGLARVGVSGIAVGVVAAVAGSAAGLVCPWGDLAAGVLSATTCMIVLAALTLATPTGRRHAAEVLGTLRLLRTQRG